MDPRDLTPWVRATAALTLVHLGIFTLVHARPGRIAVILWYSHPPLAVLVAVSLLAIGLARTLRGRQRGPGASELAAYAMLAAVVGSVVLFPRTTSGQARSASGCRLRGR